MKQMGAVILAAVLAGAARGAEDEISVKTMPPSVISTVPECGDTRVDPDLKEISVTFSKDMMTDRMWSICRVSADHFPEGRGDIHFKNSRTCVYPVKLKPGQTYVLWFNRGQFNSFRDIGGRPAVPYQLVFKTKNK